MQGLPFEISLINEDADDRFFMDEAFKSIGYEAEVRKFINGKALMYYLEQIETSLYPSLILMNDQNGYGACIIEPEIQSRFSGYPFYSLYKYCYTC